MGRKRGIYAQLGRLIFASSATGIAACGIGANIDDYASGSVSTPTGNPSAGAGGSESSVGGSGAGAHAGSAGASGHGGTSTGAHGGSTSGSGGQSSAAGGATGVGAGGAHAGQGGTHAGGNGAAGSSTAGHGGSAQGGSGQGGADGAQGGGASAGYGGQGGQTSSLVGTACTPDGTYACDGNAVTTILACSGGKWMVSTNCENGQLCDSSMDSIKSDRCANPVAACIGHAPGAVVCDGVNRITCGIDLVTSTTQVCATAAQCMLGVASACAVCAPGAFQCTGAALSKCADDGSAFQPVKTCASAALCNTTVGDCSNAVCAAGQYQCATDELQSCNAALTGWENTTACSAGSCDAANKHCDVCTPGATSCKDGSTAQSCPADGSGFQASACPGGTPHCVGNGQCVACVQATDCPAPANPCSQAACSNGVCGTSPVGNGTATAAQTGGDCKTQVCDGMNGTTNVANTGDVPPGDGNPCHTPVCNGASPGYGDLGQGTACGGGNVCNTGGACCTPKTCATAGATCVAMADGCGGTLPACTSCAGQSTCSAATSMCVCAPLASDSCPVTWCGSHADGCGGTVICDNQCDDLGEICKGTICGPLPCFAAGTMVSMADGSSKAIERMNVGDWVVTFDAESGTIGANVVLRTFDHDESTSDAGTILINGEIEATPNHPFYSAGKWIRADKLTLGSELLGIGSEGAETMAVRSASVSSIALRPGHIRTYNLEVQGAHDYFVDGILVHNKQQP